MLNLSKYQSVLHHSQTPPTLSIGGPVAGSGGGTGRATGSGAAGPGSGGGEPGSAPGAQSATQEPGSCTRPARRSPRQPEPNTFGRRHRWQWGPESCCCCRCCGCSCSCRQQLRLCAAACGGQVRGEICFMRIRNVSSKSWINSFVATLQSFLHLW